MERKNSYRNNVHKKFATKIADKWGIVREIPQDIVIVNVAGVFFKPKDDAGVPGDNENVQVD